MENTQIKLLDENPSKKIQLIWMYKESCRQVTGRCEYGPHSERAAGWRRCRAAGMTQRVVRAGPGGDVEGGGREALDRQAARCPCLGSCAMQSPSSSSSIGQTVQSSTCSPGIWGKIKPLFYFVFWPESAGMNQNHGHRSWREPMMRLSRLSG